MSEQTDVMNEDMPSRVEWRLEQEKLKLERERIALERERLEAMRDRVQIERDGKGVMRLSSAVLASIICLLVGGMLGAFSMSVRQERVRTQRMQDLVQSLSGGAEVVEETAVVNAPPAELPAEGGGSNDVVVAVATPPPRPVARPLQVRTVRPKGGGGEGSGSGISLIVIQ